MSKISQTVNLLLMARRLAKENEEFGLADRLRDELANMGLVVTDSKDGQIIREDKEKIAELASRVEFLEGLDGYKAYSENYGLRVENEHLNQKIKQLQNHIDRGLTCQ